MATVRILAVVHKAQSEPVFYACLSKPAVKSVFKTLSEVGINPIAWRLWDDGWVDGTPDAWRYVDSIDHVKATIVY